MRAPRKTCLASSVALVVVCGVIASGCGSGDAKTAAARAPVSQDVFRPANFGNPATGANRWDPMLPGRQSVREGRVNVGHRPLTHRRVYTVTNLTKRINGVPAAVVIDQDFNGGQLAEQALDYLAEDKRGNVWYLGSYTETYEGGRFVNATDGWLAGVRGATPGIMMQAHPKAGTSFYETRSLGRAGNAAQVVKTGQTKCVPFKCFNDVVVIGEGARSDQPEYKYYAPGVGGILTEPRYKGGEQETELLINATQLTPRGLAEISAAALKVDRHARVVSPRVFGNAASAKPGV
jgi:hypothetical protein